MAIIVYPKVVNTQQESNKAKRNRRILNSVPLVAGACTGILTKGSLSTKAIVGTKNAAMWGVGFAAVDLANFAEKLATRKSNTVRNFKDKHPIMTTIGSLAGTLAISTAAIFGATKLGSKIATKMQKPINTLIQKVDTSRYNTKILPEIKAMSQKLPENVRALGREVLKWAPLVLAFSTWAPASKNTK